MRTNCFFTILWLVFVSLPSKAQELFQSEEIIQLKIVAHMRTLLKDRGENPIYHQANLFYIDNHGDTVGIPIKIKVRGNFRRSIDNCDFPPLMIDIPKKKGKKTLFEKQDRLKLVTQCQKEEYIFQEYIIYKLYNLITDLSFKTRMVQVTYIDSLGKRKPETDFGFLIESEDEVAKRNKAKTYAGKQIGQPLADTITMATLAVFEYLIGNCDWSVPALHNIKLFTKTGKLFLPTPYDFDHSGIINADYAMPPPQLNISSVRERLYRGLNYPPSVFQQVFDKFNNLKPQIYNLYESSLLLSERTKKITKRYLDDFYESINDTKAIKKYFTTY